MLSLSCILISARVVAIPHIATFCNDSTLLGRAFFAPKVFLYQDYTLHRYIVISCMHYKQCYKIIAH